jgi:uncharacterized protein (DUF362 family)
MRVSVARTAPRYPAAPFHPSEHYPELARTELSGQDNPVYRAVRQALHLLGFDAANYGTAAWNPLRHMVRPGSRVVIKPNFVNHYNPISDERSYFEALVTQAAVLRPLLDYVLLASGDDCVVTFADLPIQSSDFESIARSTGLTAVMDHASRARATVQMLDLRGYRLVTDRSGAVLERRAQPGDRHGYVTVDLGAASSLVAIDEHAHLFRAPDYHGDDTVRLHSGGAHKYILPKTILSSDVLINVPKLKVHRKVGATLCLKNLVGIIGDKGCLPHWRAGGPADHGDEFAVTSAINSLRGHYSFALRRLGGPIWKLARPLGRLLARVNQATHSNNPLTSIINGDWYGNDTTWRMVHDLNRIALHADEEGRLHDQPQRHYLGVVDGVIGGEGEGPLSPHPVRSGLIVAGTDPLANDIVCSRLMGLDWRAIPQFSRFEPRGRYAFSAFRGEVDEIQVASSDDASLRSLATLSPVHRFEPSRGWKGHIELGP